jgi:ABC-type transporter Mla subunit MlaD
MVSFRIISIKLCCETANQKVFRALNDIVTKARQVDELASEVSGASREQSQDITQIHTAVGQMDKVTQANAASAEKSAAAAEELNTQAESLNQSVAELMHLLGGDAKNSTPATEVKKVLAKLVTNGHAKFTTKASPNRSFAQPSEIPLAVDFKDFEK